MAPHVSKSMSNTRRCQLIRTQLTVVVISRIIRLKYIEQSAHDWKLTATHAGILTELYTHTLEISIINWLICNRHVCFRFFLFLFTEPRKEKTDVSCSGGGGGVNGGNNALSPNNEQGCQGGLMQQGSGGLNNHHLSTPKLERPNSLGGSNKISRRIVCYHGDHCKYIRTLRIITWIVT